MYFHGLLFLQKCIDSITNLLKFVIYFDLNLCKQFVNIQPKFIESTLLLSPALEDCCFPFDKTLIVIHFFS
jgi:hypothetical protein